MKKQLNMESIANELQTGSVFFPGRKESTSQSIDQSTNQPTNEPTNSTTTKETHEPTNKPDDNETPRSIDTSVILGKPKAFYITVNQDSDLDVLVKNLSAAVNGKVNQKIDRSTVVRLLLEEAELSKKQTANRLANRLINRLISQLRG